jgi:hypothetical protein
LLRHIDRAMLKVLRVSLKVLTHVSVLLYFLFIVNGRHLCYNRG